MTTTESEFVHHIDRHEISNMGQVETRFLVSHLCHPSGNHPPNLWGEEICIDPEPCGPECPWCQGCNPVAFPHGPR